MNKLWSAARKSDGSQRNSSNIRGRISAPIPIATDDDEFPIRSPGARLATPVGYESVEEQLRQTDTEASEGLGTMHSHISPARSIPFRQEPQHSSRDALRRSITGSSRFRETGPTGPLADPAKPERKKGPLRSVLGRLFGKKRMSSNSPSSNGQVVKGVGAYQHRHHKSDPTLLAPRTRPLSPKRSTSLPINEHTRVLTTPSPPARSRRATIPSLISQPGQPLPAPIFPSLSGLSPRPTSHRDGAISRIGQALTIGAHPHRRSRSLGQLHRSESGDTPRRRSAEIRWWRESSEAATAGPETSLLSPWGSPRPGTAHSQSGRAGPAPEDDDYAMADELREMETEGWREESHDHESWPALLEPFNFSPAPSVARPPLTATQAAALEDRVLFLEERLLRMEATLRALEATRAPLHALVPVPRDAHTSPHSSTGSSSPTMRRHTTQPAPAPGPPSPSPTIRRAPYYPAFSAMPLATYGALTAHHYSALLNLIQAERHARREVEGKVAVLERAVLGGVATLEAPGGRVGLRGLMAADAERGEEDEQDVFHAPSEKQLAWQRAYMEREAAADAADEDAPRTLSLSQMTMGLRRGPVVV